MVEIQSFFGKKQAKVGSLSLVIDARCNFGHFNRIQRPHPATLTTISNLSWTSLKNKYYIKAFQAILKGSQHVLKHLSLILTEDDELDDGIDDVDLLCSVFTEGENGHILILSALSSLQLEPFSFETSEISNIRKIFNLSSLKYLSLRVCHCSFIMLQQLHSTSRFHTLQTLELIIDDKYESEDSGLGIAPFYSELELIESPENLYVMLRPKQGGRNLYRDSIIQQSTRIKRFIWHYREAGYQSSAFADDRLLDYRGWRQGDEYLDIDVGAMHCGLKWLMAAFENKQLECLGLSCWNATQVR